MPKTKYLDTQVKYPRFTSPLSLSEAEPSSGDAWTEVAFHSDPLKDEGFAQDPRKVQLSPVKPKI